MLNSRETRRSGSNLNARQASKGPSNKTQLELAQNVMSQESIKNYVEDAEIETQKEKKRLELQEN